MHQPTRFGDGGNVSGWILSMRFFADFSPYMGYLNLHDSVLSRSRGNIDRWSFFPRPPNAMDPGPEFSRWVIPV
jgi:hypothetical protein